MMIAVAVNPRASFGRARHTGKEAAARFRAAGADVLLLGADSYSGLAQAVEVALESCVDALVMVGGDGMVHVGINALAGAGDGARVPLGIIPTGTGNDTARALGLPLHNLPAACERVLQSLADGGRMIDAAGLPREELPGGSRAWSRPGSTPPSMNGPMSGVGREAKSATSSPCFANWPRSGPSTTQ